MHHFPVDFAAGAGQFVQVFLGLGVVAAGDCTGASVQGEGPVCSVFGIPPIYTKTAEIHACPTPVITAGGASSARVPGDTPDIVAEMPRKPAWLQKNNIVSDCL